MGLGILFPPSTNCGDPFVAHTEQKDQITVPNTFNVCNQPKCTAGERGLPDYQAHTKIAAKAQIMHPCLFG